MKARRFDLWPEDFIAGVAGELTEAELGVYWMVCLLCYTHGGSIPADPVWLRSKFRASKGNWIVKPILDRLVAIGKVAREGDQITVRRVRDEVERTLRRIRVGRESGLRGGRPSSKTNAVAKGSDAPARITNSNKQIADSSMAANAANAREPLPAVMPTDFARWWLVYPHKVGKGAAEKAYATASRAASLDELIEGVRRYSTAKPPDHNWCNPATWLNQRRWEDQPADLLNPQGVNGHARRSPVEKLYAGAAAAVEEYERRQGGGSFGDGAVGPLLDR